jgi:hypothetical protein
MGRDCARRNVFSGVLGRRRRRRHGLQLVNSGREIRRPQRIFNMERRIRLKRETKLDQLGVGQQGQVGAFEGVPFRVGRC